MLTVVLYVCVFVCLCVFVCVCVRALTMGVHCIRPMLSLVLTAMNKPMYTCVCVRARARAHHGACIRPMFSSGLTAIYEFMYVYSCVKCVLTAISLHAGARHRQGYRGC